jgi:hypothetical protein
MGLLPKKIPPYFGGIGESCVLRGQSTAISSSVKILKCHTTAHSINDTADFFTHVSTVHIHKSTAINTTLSPIQQFSEY